MVTYGDYFSRKTLHVCGVSPSLKMGIKDEMGYTGMQRTQSIRSDMVEIYNTLYNGLSQKNVQNPQEELSRLNVQQKILSAFYDSGVLTDTEKEYFQTQSFLENTERERIHVAEADDCALLEKSAKIVAPPQEQVIRNVK